MPTLCLPYFLEPMLRHPPVSEAFLRKIGNAEFLSWTGTGVFTVLRKTVSCAQPVRQPFFEQCLQSLPSDTGDYPTITIDEDSDLIEPDSMEKPTDTAHCFHGAEARKLTVKRSDSPNRGRVFYSCCLGSRCGFFRWEEDLENGNFSDVQVSRAKGQPCYDLTTLQQLGAWYTTAQGSPEWLKLRFGRITASNFGAITGTNPYASQDDYLRSLLWETRMDGRAMRWGSINEHVASESFQKFLAAQAGGVDTVLVEDRGIWIPSDLPYVGGSPDGIVYQIECIEEANGQYEVLRCSRCLLEIKTPWKVRNRKPGDDFYPHIEVPLGSGRRGACPEYYMDQVNGNCALMGLKAAYFVVLTRTGFQVTYIPFAGDYWEGVLRPRLVRFYYDFLKPSQEVQQNGGLEFGMVPTSGSDKRPYM
jgi:hypothetical protein